MKKYAGEIKISNPKFWKWLMKNKSGLDKTNERMLMRLAGWRGA